MKKQRLPVSKIKFGLAKQDSLFREGFFKQTLRLGTCDSIGEIEDHFNATEDHITFMENVGLIAKKKKS